MLLEKFVPAIMSKWPSRPPHKVPLQQDNAKGHVSACGSEAIKEDNRIILRSKLLHIHQTRPIITSMTWDFSGRLILCDTKLAILLLMTWSALCTKHGMTANLVSLTRLTLHYRNLWKNGWKYTVLTSRRYRICTKNRRRSAGSPITFV